MGFNLVSSIKYWDTVGSSNVNHIQEVFSSLSINEEWNQTMICLIPKIQCPSSIKNFRPISLCTTIYKIVSKILVKRLKPIISSAISFNQGAFNPGRKPTDNVVIAQDLVFRFQKKRGQMGWMLIKLNLEKTYDKINWKFLLDALQFFGMPLDSLKLIHSCLSTVKHQILINGELSGNICPSHGIHQGDPLSPYLFIIAMEMLTKCIDLEVSKGKWKAPLVKGIKISHLLYVDDVLLFVKTDRNSVLAVKRALETFLEISGLSVNESKSSIWFSPNTREDEKVFAARILPYKHSPKPGNYLDKVEAWKAPMLSKASRVTLIKSISVATANYYMQSLPFPISICKEIDKIHRNFLWGSNSERKKLHLVNWDVICRNKRSGRLGIPKSHERNLAFLTSLYWRTLAEKESVWEKVCTARMNLSSGKNSILGEMFSKRKFIDATPFGAAPNLNDIRVWKFDPRGVFSVQSAYKAIMSSKHRSSVTNFGWIWKLSCHLRQKFFIWLCYRDALPHNTNLVRRGININAYCPRCGSLLKSIEHIFKSCPISIKFWDLARIHVTSCLHFAVMRVVEFSHLVIADNIASIRDSNGNWVMGFSKFLGGGTILYAELWAIVYGLDLAYSAGGSKIVVESDSLSAIALIIDLNTPVSHHLFPIISRCRSFLRVFEEINFSHKVREVNFCADALAKYGVKLVRDRGVGVASALDCND
ncbi:reverse transcriptase [Senna tora]|uniref:Reverse transcriptase n=1 Tax=Senna tora TaxID=362788 RepID=A0A834W6N5_9FABA|nr:reverse transcriptase [Senna tora]